VNCDNPDRCPINGNWCAWSEFPDICSDDCNHQGLGLWVRNCACPEPQFNGAKCKHADDAFENLHDLLKKVPNNLTEKFPTAFSLLMIYSGEAKWDKCNRRPCPHHKILTDSEHFYIAQNIAQMQPYEKHQEPKKGSLVLLECDDSLPAMKHIFANARRFPEVRSFWTRTPQLDHKITSAKPREVLYVNYKQETPGDFIMECDFRVLWPVMKSTMSGYWYVYWELERNQTKEKLKTLYLQNGSVIADMVKTVKNQPPEKRITPWDARFKGFRGVKQHRTGIYSCKLSHSPLTGHADRIFTISTYDMEFYVQPNYIVMGFWWLVEHEIFAILFTASIAIVSTALFLYFLRIAMLVKSNVLNKFSN
ncbi:hypothetical protein Ciccas_012382, partial [Cichlidogyrus casuarinus]